MDGANKIEAIADEAVALLGTSRLVPTFSARHGGLSLAEAYRVVEAVKAKRIARGDKPIGRKIGFTNRSAWTGFNIDGPMWNYMFDTTVSNATADDAVAVGDLTEVRIEPEIVLHLAKAPSPGMGTEALLGCVDWVAHGFEIVRSIFPNWSFTAADAIAGYGVHRSMIVGPPRPVAGMGKELETFTIKLIRNGEVAAAGTGSDTLGGPVQALGFLLEEIRKHPGTAPVGAGEVITTGTLTKALPMKPGDIWTTELTGIDLPGLRLRVIE